MCGPGELAADGLAIGSRTKRQALAPGHFRTDAGHFPFAQIGEQVAPIEDASILLPRGIALCNMMLSPLSIASRTC